MRFNNVEYLPTDFNLHYYWSNRFAQCLMDLALKYLEDDYSIHRSGGYIIDFDNILAFLVATAESPIVNELISMKEIESAIIQENQNLVEQLICDLENQSIEPDED